MIVFLGAIPAVAQQNVTTLKSWVSNCTGRAMPLRLSIPRTPPSTPVISELDPATGTYTRVMDLDHSFLRVHHSVTSEYELDACGMSPVDSFLYCIWFANMNGFAYLEERRLVRIGSDGSAEFVAKLPFYSGCNDLDADGGCDEEPGYAHTHNGAFDSHGNFHCITTKLAYDDSCATSNDGTCDDNCGGSWDRRRLLSASCCPPGTDATDCGQTPGVSSSLLVLDGLFRPDKLRGFSDFEDPSLADISRPKLMVESGGNLFYYWMMQIDNRNDPDPPGFPNLNAYSAPTVDLVLANPIDGCSPLNNSTNWTGKVVLIEDSERASGYYDPMLTGSAACGGVDKAANAQAAGARAVVIYDLDRAVRMRERWGDAVPPITIPVAQVYRSEGMSALRVHCERASIPSRAL